MNWLRLRALIIKELLATLRDPKSRFVLFGPPIMQLLVFSTAATLDVRNIDLVALNYDVGSYSDEMLERLGAATPTVRQVVKAATPAEVNIAIDRQQAIAALVFQSDFSRRIERGETANVQVILDGRKSNTAQIAFGYINEIAAGLSSEIVLAKQGARGGIVIKPQYWFNPNLIFQWFMVLNLVASIALLIGVMVTALSIARERETGTFDQLLVSPLEAHEILAGKVIPPMIIGFAQLATFVLAALFIFSVPLRGSLVLMFVSAFFFLLSVAGIGLFISALAYTQQQAILGAFFFLAPAMLLSGFTTPIENMPEWLQPLTYLNPLRYFLIIVRGVFLKNLPATEIFYQTWPMAIIAVVTLTLATILFRRRLE